MINCNKRLHYIIFIVERDFLPKNGSNFTIEQQKTRSLISKSQLRILDAVRENVFLEFAILDKAYNDMSSGYQICLHLMKMVSWITVTAQGLYKKKL